MPPASPVVESRLREQLLHELGHDLVEVLDNPDVLEILLNPDGSVWVEHKDRGMEPLGLMLPPERAEALLGTLAALSRLTISHETPTVECILPVWRYRVAGSLPPVSPAPTLVIRKPPPQVFRLEDLLARDLERLAYFRAAITERRNIVVSGATGAGKTAFANSLLRELVLQSPTERILVLEDNPEIPAPGPNCVTFTTTPTISLAHLLRLTLRYHPQRIVVGEVRGAEALDLLKAWNTGHPGGLATVHANSAAAALARLDQLAQEANVPSQALLVREAVDLVVHLTPRCQIAEVLEPSKPTAFTHAKETS